MTLNDGLILGLGSPLMDIIAKVDYSFLNKYGLKPNSAILSTGVHLKIYEELTKNEVVYIPGGSPQNTLRTLSWILKRPNVATFMGAVGQDQNAEIMMRKNAEIGLKTIYQIDEKNETGTCLVLITGNERSLITNPGAANSFTLANMQNNWTYVEKAQMFYISSYFFLVDYDSIKAIADFSERKDRDFVLNLSAPFLCQRYGKEIIEIMPYVDILFGNDDEFRAFAEFMGIENNSLANISKVISNLYKINGKNRIVVVTQGSGPVICTSGAEFSETSVAKIESEKIVDTNGAGDAFVGGFLSQFIKGEILKKCIDCGIWSASLIIQQQGCTFPNEEYN